MAERNRIILPGGGGFLGRHLAGFFVDQGYEVVVLSRRSLDDRPGVRHLVWDGRTIGPWAAAFDGARAVINLAGRTVNCRYTAKNRQEIYDSRLQSTAVIGQAIAACAAPPPVWLNSSSATIYRDADDRPMDEATGELGTGFSVDVCRKWEAALDAAPTPRTRKVALRSAMVMSPAEKSTESGTVMIITDAIARGFSASWGAGSPSSASCFKAPDFWSTVVDTLTENNSRTAVMRDAVTTSRNLPRTRWVRETGLERIVSMVPRSFSPAVKSIAGCMAPWRHIKISM